MRHRGTWQGGAAALLLVAATASPAQSPEPSPYEYSTGGRRDPFANPQAVVDDGARARCRCGGPGGFLTQEIALRGLIRTRGGQVAMVEGPDRKSYQVKVGERLFDGRVTGVDALGLTVRQELTDPLAREKTRDVRILLHADTTPPDD